MLLKKFTLILSICFGILFFSNNSFAQSPQQPKIAPQPQPAGTPKMPQEPVKQFKTTKKTNVAPAPKAPSKNIKRRKSKKAIKKQDDNNQPDAGPASVANMDLTDNQHIAYL